MTGTIEPKRGQWGNHVEFMLACLGYAVGLGNVWRFPYLCYENGGGAFLVPYIIALVVAGLPVFFMELALGQFSSLGPNCIYGKIAPVFQGIGWGMIVITVIVMLYYNMIIAWVLFYFFASFRKTVMWDNCRNWWNTPVCQSNRETQRCEKLLNDSMALFFNKECIGSDNSKWDYVNGTIAAMVKDETVKGPADEYFHKYVLEITDSFEDMGGLSWKLVLALLGAWIIVFLCLYKGVQSTGKVVYFTATFPYLVLVILMIRGATLPGAAKGIKFYIVPKFYKLKDIKVWKQAATQIFYSLGPAFGGLITMSSYNPFKNNCLSDAIKIAVGNCATSVFAGFAIFSVVGFMSQDLKIPIENVTEQGPGLAFIAYPEAISRMPLSPIWAILFFFMLITLGLDSQFAMVETATTALFDQFPHLRQKKTTVIASVCAIMFLLGLPLCARGGFYLFTLIDAYSAGYCLILIALFEVIMVVYVYGLKQFLKDIEMMIGYKPNWYWRICWYALAPFFLMFIFIFSLIGYKPAKYRGYTFKNGGEILGWIISLLSIVTAIGFAVYRVLKDVVFGQKPWKYLIRPTPEWCPAEVRAMRSQQTKVSQIESMEKVVQSFRPYPNDFNPHPLHI